VTLVLSPGAQGWDLLAETCTDFDTAVDRKISRIEYFCEPNAALFSLEILAAYGSSNEQGNQYETMLSKTMYDDSQTQP